MSADHYPRSFVPYHGFNVSEFLYAPLELLLFGIAGLQIFSWIVFGSLKVCHHSLFNLHIFPPYFRHQKNRTRLSTVFLELFIYLVLSIGDNLYKVFLAFNLVWDYALPSD